MGWAYDNALYGYFHLSPLDLGFSIVEYMLRSLTLFSTNVVFAAVGLILVTAIRSWNLSEARTVRLVARRATIWRSVVPDLRVFANVTRAESLRAGRLLLIGAGTALTITALVLRWSTSHIPISGYVALGLLGGGPLLLTWPTRAERLGRFPYSLAVVVAAVWALWAGSVYANGVGNQAAKAIVQNLPARTAVVVYSIQRLALSGPGVTVEQLPAGFLYHYRYVGLRLLTTRSGTYYVLPVGWSRRYDLTYVLNQSDQIRIELLSGVVPS